MCAGGRCTRRGPWTPASSSTAKSRCARVHVGVLLDDCHCMHPAVAWRAPWRCGALALESAASQAMHAISRCHVAVQAGAEKKLYNMIDVLSAGAMR